MSTWIIDILPQQVPYNSGGQYGAVERYFLQKPGIFLLRCKYAELMIRLNAYYAMNVSYDTGASWETDPEPEDFVRKVSGLRPDQYLCVSFPAVDLAFEMDSTVTYMSFYLPEREEEPEGLLDMIRQLAAAAGVFCWRAPE